MTRSAILPSCPRQSPCGWQAVFPREERVYLPPALAAARAASRLLGGEQIIIGAWALPSVLR
jgi:hypothetical protein